MLSCTSALTKPPSRRTVNVAHPIKLLLPDEQLIFPNNIHISADSSDCLWAKMKTPPKKWDNDGFHLAVYKCYFLGNLFWCKIYFVLLTMHASLIMGLFSGQTLLTVIFHLKFPRAEMLLLHRACGEMNADFEWHIANCCVIINWDSSKCWYLLLCINS